MNRDWFRFGAKLGRFKILRARRHGESVQRYDAFDLAAKKPVIITCARPDRASWEKDFERLAKRRAALDFEPRLVDWGVSDKGVFYLAEQNLGTEPLITYPWGAVAGYVLFYALADNLADLADEGWMHGALDPSETLGRIDKELVVYGGGFLQILGCAGAPGIVESAYTAPEMQAGLPLDERADVWSACAIITELSRGKQDTEAYYSALGMAREPLLAGFLPLDERPNWAALLPAVKILASNIGSFPKSKPNSSHKRKCTPETHVEPCEMFGRWTVHPEERLPSDAIHVCLTNPLGNDEILGVIRWIRPTLPGVEWMGSPEEFHRWVDRRRALQIQGIPELFEGDITPEGCPYWVEHGMRGLTLPDYLNADHSAGEKPRRTKTLETILGAAKILGQCAKSGLFHGDLLPDRDLLFEDDAKDFYVRGIGAVQSFGTAKTPSANPFAAPERKRGESFDHRADMYALAEILHNYHLEFTPISERGEACRDALQAYRAAEAEFLRRTKAPDPADRFQTWSAFLDAVSQCLMLWNRYTEIAAEAQPQENQTTEGGEKLAALLEQVTVEPAPITVRSLRFEPDAAGQHKQAKRGIWAIGGIAMGAAAAFALLWWARVPALVPTESATHEAGFEPPALLWTLSTAEARPSKSHESSKSPAFLGEARAPSRPEESRACRIGYCRKGRKWSSRE